MITSIQVNLPYCILYRGRFFHSGLELLPVSVCSHNSRTTETNSRIFRTVIEVINYADKSLYSFVKFVLPEELGANCATKH